jgi:hypothetical protein
MDSDNQRKVKNVTRKASFLMEHQSILPDLKEVVLALRPTGIEINRINRESPEYLLGAFEALMNLIRSLESKGD